MSLNFNSFITVVTLESQTPNCSVEHVVIFLVICAFIAICESKAHLTFSFQHFLIQDKFNMLTQTFDNAAERRS